MSSHPRQAIFRPSAFRPEHSHAPLNHRSPDHLLLRSLVLVYLLLPLLLSSLASISFLPACASHVETRRMTVTAYCGCGECNGFVRGRWLFLKLDFWNKYATYGPDKGERLTAETASGEWLWARHPGLVSLDSLKHPWWIPSRIIFPWLWLPHEGTLAADTDYYPFGTRMYIPGYGWGRVADRGGAIKGPDRLDVCVSSHGRTFAWGRRTIEVQIYRE